MLRKYSYVQLYMLGLPSQVKYFIILFFDTFSALFAVWLAFSIRLEIFHWPIGREWLIYLLSVLLLLPIFWYAGIYRVIHRHSDYFDLMKVIKAFICYAVIFFCLVLLLNFHEVPRAVALLQPLILLIIIVGGRDFVRFWYTTISTVRATSFQQQLLIYGAGSAGVEMANAIHRSPKFVLAGFIDDNIELHGRTINGVNVYSPEQALKLLEQQGIYNILIAIPSATRARRNQLVQIFINHRVNIQIIPALEELADGKLTISDVKDIDIEDLLSRDSLPVDHELISKRIKGLIVMVTGAGGSIGSELSRQILAGHPSTLLLVDQSELNLYTIHSDLEYRVKRFSQPPKVIPLLADVADTSRIAEILRVYKPSIIYHAAAYKHVPMVERNPVEGIRNNVFGTLCVAELARQHGVSRVVLVSTDKAVRPTSVMGASKRLCEMIFQALAPESDHDTCFSIVRFGNVLGSSGSVVPLFRRQIKAGGPVTVTHKEITRYFMTISEAAQLVIQAGAMASNGELFLLEMGEPVKIIDLARKMVELSGLSLRDDENTAGDIEICLTGLRPGEKLYEELLIGKHSLPSDNPRIFKAMEQFMSWGELHVELEHLTTAISQNDMTSITLLLQRVIPEYQSNTVLTGLLSFEEQSLNNV